MNVTLTLTVEELHALLKLAGTSVANKTRSSLTPDECHLTEDWWKRTFDRLHGEGLRDAAINASATGKATR